jgi:hypothetical protein
MDSTPSEKNKKGGLQKIIVKSKTSRSTSMLRIKLPESNRSTSKQQAQGEY